MKYYYNTLAVIVFGLTVVLVGCNTYTRVNYCWTSDHHLSPTNRVLSLDCSSFSVMEKSMEWVRENGGKVLDCNTSAKKMVVIPSDAEADFQMAKAMVDVELSAYKANRYHARTDGEFDQLKKLMAGQVLPQDTDRASHYLKAKLNKRSTKEAYRVQTGTRKSQMLVGGFTSYSSVPGGIKTTKAPSMLMSMPGSSVPVYETRYRDHDFYSIISILVFETDNGTKIYARAVPYDEPSSLLAAYGNSIGHDYWSFITGEAEAKLVRDLFLHLKCK